MDRFIKLAQKTVIAALLLTFTPAVAEDAPPTADSSSTTFLATKGLFLHGMLGVNLLSAPSNSSSDSRFVFVPGIGMEYFFTPRVGVFTGLDYSSKGFKSGVTSSTANFVDLSFGLAFSPGQSFLSSDSRSHVRLGMMYSIKTGDYDNTTLLNVSNPAKSYFGIYAGFDTNFVVSDHFTLGYTVYFKYGLGSATSSTIVENRFTEAGMGLTFGYF